MNKLANTLKDLRLITSKNGIDYLITRFDRKNKNPSDLDVLVKKENFKKFVKIFIENGYITESHDFALGGRIKGYQINLLKKGRIKIDLHKDFTWRKEKYLNLDLLWNKVKLSDQFLVFINTIFEKTYIDSEDYKYIWNKKDIIFENKNFYNQSEKYSWSKTFKLFKDWKPETKNFPLFLPFFIIIFSYLEKFNLKSLLYYLFFRIRYFFTKTLPYD